MDNEEKDKYINKHETVPCKFYLCVDERFDVENNPRFVEAIKRLFQLANEFGLDGRKARGVRFEDRDDEDHGDWEPGYSQYIVFDIYEEK